jgi:hypothetical protein
MHHSVPLVAPSPSRQRSRQLLQTSQNCELPCVAIYETTPPNTPHASNTLTNQSNLSGWCACTPSPSSPHTRGLYNIAWRMVGHVFSISVCQVVSYFSWPHREVSRRPRCTRRLGPRHCHNKNTKHKNNVLHRSLTLQCLSAVAVQLRPKQVHSLYPKPGQSIDVPAQSTMVDHEL